MLGHLRTQTLNVTTSPYRRPNMIFKIDSEYRIREPLNNFDSAMFIGELEMVVWCPVPINITPALTLLLEIQGHGLGLQKKAIGSGRKTELRTVNKGNSIIYLKDVIY